MRRICFAIAAIMVSGCGGKPAPDPRPTVDVAVVPDASAEFPALLPAVVAPPSADAQYEIALGESIGWSAQGKLNEALSALEKARAAKDTDIVRNEIERIKAQIAQNAAAAQTAEALKIVLNQGRADEAARLATEALAQFGGGESAETFINFKRQADALLVGETNQASHAATMRREADAAFASKNLRAALAAYEQANATAPDAAMTPRIQELRKTISQYDEWRDRGAELRRDPERLEEALEFYRRAATNWDTLQVRQDIEACNAALQNRRDRVAIADFEVRGDIGLPSAGRALAEELLPVFRGRFDVVERQQFDKLAGELKLQSSELYASDGPRGEFGRLGRIRYLVLGSVTPMAGGIAVSARMVEARSGLVVQTAKVVAPSANALVRLMPQLGTMLQMNDAERLAYEQSLSNIAPPSALQPAANFPPMIATGGPPPAPIVTYAPVPPGYSTVTYEDFSRLPTPVSEGGGGVALVIDTNHGAKPRLAQLAIELGDNLFRRGRVNEAKAQFQLALNLSPGQSLIQLRLDKCGPAAPPPPPPRLRMAVLDFVTPGDRGSVPPGLGAILAEQLGPYFSPPYDVLDRGQVYWYMGRLGISMRDAIVDPSARAYLGQALGVRYFIVGTIRPTPLGLEVAAHQLDATSGARLDLASIVVRNQAELKLRLPEIAQWMLMDPRERVARLREAEAFQRVVIDGESFIAGHKYPQAMQSFTLALKARPQDVRVQSLLAQAERQARIVELETARQRERERDIALAAAYRTRQEQLARDAAQARREAERAAAAVNEAERQRQKRAAYDRLVAQARTARDQNRWKESQQLFESALAFERGGDVVRELDGVKSRLADLERTKAAELKAAQEAKLRQAREDELAKLRASVENERRQREAEQKTRMKIQEDRDRTEYARLISESARLQAANRHDDAIDLLRNAQRIKPGAEAQGLLSAAIAQRAKATEAANKQSADKAMAEAQTKAKQQADAQAAAILLAQRQAEEQRRREAEAKAKALPPPLPKPKEAVKTNTPPLLPKEKAKEATPPPLPKDRPKIVPPPLPKEQPKPKDVAKAMTPPPLPKDQSKAKENVSSQAFNQKMQAGLAAERNGKFSEALQRYQEALAITPGDANARNRSEYANAMDVGAKAMNSKQFAVAVKSFEAALKVFPGDAAARRALDRAKAGK